MPVYQKDEEIFAADEDLRQRVRALEDETGLTAKKEAEAKKAAEESAASDKPAEQSESAPAPKAAEAPKQEAEAKPTPKTGGASR